MSGFSVGDVKRSKPHVLPAPQQVHMSATVPPPDRSWRVDYPNMTEREHTALIDALSVDGGSGSARAAHVEYINLAHRNASAPSLVVAPVRQANVDALPRPDSPLDPAQHEAQTGNERRVLRTSVSAGQLNSGPVGAGCGDNQYLQRLPPVIRRSVCGTGPRQHSQAVGDGTRRSDGTVPAAGPTNLPDKVPRPPTPPPQPWAQSEAEMLAKVYAL
jgi:hypothetical protein